MGEKYFDNWKVTIIYRGDFKMGQDVMNEILKIINDKIPLKIVEAKAEMI